MLRGTVPDGTEVAVPACMVATVADGRIIASSTSTSTPAWAASLSS